MATNDSLPRLAYIGEVPVRNISAGPALLYRLLETYPRNRLIIVESADNAPSPDTQLPVTHRPFFLMHRRLMQTRFARTYGAWIYGRAAARGRRLAARLQDFRPEAILSVAHGFGWITAAAAAAVLKVPLHLIVHDHWRPTMSIPHWLENDAERLFAKTYCNAASRMPVSPDMEAHYRSLYGAAGVVVYPSSGADAFHLTTPPFRTPISGAFVFAYAGSAPSSGQRRALADFANATASLGVRLRIYQELTLKQLRRDGLRTDNVDIASFLPVDALHRALLDSVDAMYLPMSFAPEDRDNVELCFPSKLTDYTIPGLPILVRAPDYGTAANWAKSYPQAAILITNEDPSTLAAAVQRIVNDAPYRHALATHALEIGQHLFAQTIVFKIFSETLRQPWLSHQTTCDQQS